VYKISGIAAIIESSILKDSFELIRRYFTAFRKLIRSFSLSNSDLHDGRELVRRIDISIRVLTDVFPRSINDGVAFVLDDIKKDRRDATCKGAYKDKKIVNIMSCLRYKRNVNSQNGEDGIIEYIMGKIGVKRGNFIEFGAWDGKHLSNCYKLVEEGWSGIYIEADDKKYEDLKASFGDKEGITVIKRLISHEGDDTLDNIIDECEHKNKEFDIISIDVDGLDYNIFKSMREYLPSVIIIEVNAGHSPTSDKEIEIGIAKNNIGQSLSVVCREGERKGYFALCYTGNLFLVKNEYKDIFAEDVKDIRSIYIDFLDHLNEEELEYLYKLFVLGKYFNGMIFENDVLREYCELKYRA
jgi:hypothetical protein